VYGRLRQRRVSSSDALQLSKHTSMRWRSLFRVSGLGHMHPFFGDPHVPEFESALSIMSELLFLASSSPRPPSLHKSLAAWVGAELHKRGPFMLTRLKSCHSVSAFLCTLSSSSCFIRDLTSIVVVRLPGPPGCCSMWCRRQPFRRGLSFMILH